MKGYIDTITFEIDNSILAKLELIGVVTVAKNASAGTIRTASRFTSGHSAGVDSDS